MGRQASRRNRRPRVCVCPEPTPVPGIFYPQLLTLYTGTTSVIVDFNAAIESFDESQWLLLPFEINTVGSNIVSAMQISASQVAFDITDIMPPDGTFTLAILDGFTGVLFEGGVSPLAGQFGVALFV